MSRLDPRFFVAYLVMHFWIVFRAHQSFDLCSIQQLVILIIFALMVSLPVYVRNCTFSNPKPGFKFAYWATYGWMGFVFFFTFIGLGFDLLSFSVGTVEAYELGSLKALNHSNSFVFISVLSFLFVAYSIAEASVIRSKRIRLFTDKIPSCLPPFRIAHISDVHLGAIVRGRRSKRIADVIKNEQPDMLVSTGDFVDASIDHIAPEAKVFASINTTCGKYAILGNHEWYHDKGNAFRSFAADSGFTLIGGGSVSVNSHIDIFGVDDEAGKACNTCIPSEYEILPESEKDLNKYKILLKHRPEINPNTRDCFDLQLSGHTHGGQIFPFSFITRAKYPYMSGLYTPEGSSKTLLYVSRGAGTWGPPMRLFSPPEVSIVEIVGTGK